LGRLGARRRAGLVEVPIAIELTAVSEGLVNCASSTLGMPLTSARSARRSKQAIAFWSRA
jgi:hypothetical protein